MNILLKTKRKAITLVIEVLTKSKQIIEIVIQDKNKKNTKYTQRWGTVNGRRTFFIRMPLSPNEAIVSIYNKAVGNQAKGSDMSFKVMPITATPLKRKMDCINWDNPKIRDFVQFAQQFSENAGWLSAGKYPNGSTYKSNNGNFRIDYFDDIRTGAGIVIPTPARISQSQGIIQVSKRSYINMTVPMRLAILLHEFSHFLEVSF